MDRMMLKDANEKLATMMAKMRMTQLTVAHKEKRRMPRNNGKMEKIKPKTKEPQISPSRMVLIEMGQVINRSSVFCRVSHGKTTGPMEAAVKKSTIAKSPEMTYIGFTCRPIVNAKNNMVGMRKPWMMTGPLL